MSLLNCGSASLGYALSWIMAQRILIDLTEFFATRQEPSHASPKQIPRVIERPEIGVVVRLEPLTEAEEPSDEKSSGHGRWHSIFSRKAPDHQNQDEQLQDLEAELEAWRRRAGIDLNPASMDVQVVAALDNHRRQSTSQTTPQSQIPPIPEGW